MCLYCKENKRVSKGDVAELHHVICGIVNDFGNVGTCPLDNWQWTLNKYNSHFFLDMLTHFCSVDCICFNTMNYIVILKTI